MNSKYYKIKVIKRNKVAYVKDLSDFKALIALMNRTASQCDVKRKGTIINFYLCHASSSQVDLIGTLERGKYFDLERHIRDLGI